MHGFKPGGCNAHVQHLADGGVVQTIKDLLGIKPPKPRPAPVDLSKYQQPAQSGSSPQPAPAQQPQQPGSAISQYAGMTAAQRREAEAMKAAGFKHGGVIRGPGTGTSDSIPAEMPPGTYIMPADSTEELGEGHLQSLGFRPGGMPAQPRGSVAAGMGGGGKKVPVRVSNGEFELSPEQVHAIGVQVLDGLRGMTHKPANCMDPDGDEGGEGDPDGDGDGRPMLADGGVVDDKKKSTLDPQAASDRQAIGGVIDKVKEANARAGSAAADLLTMPVRGVLGAYDSAVVRPLRAFGANMDYLSPLVTPEGSDVNSPTPFYDKWRKYDAAQQDQSGKPAAPAGASTAGAGRGSINPPVVDPQAPAPSVAAPATTDSPSTQQATQPSNSSVQVNRQPNGTLSFSGTDVTGTPTYQGAGAAGFKPGGGGVNTMSAKDFASASPGLDAQLAGAKSAALDRGEAIGFQPSGAAGINGTSLASSAMDKFRNDVAIGSLQRAAAGGGRQANAAAQALSSMQGNQAQLEAAKLRDAGDTERAAIREAGDTGRAMLRESGDNQRAQAASELASQRLGLDRTAAGFKTRSAQRLESLQSAYDNAKTPEEQASIAKKIRDLSGTGQQGDSWKAVALPGGTDAMGNRTEGVLAAVNERTGEMRRFDGASTAATLPKAGEVRNGYRFKGGNPADQNAWEKV